MNSRACNQVLQVLASLLGKNLKKDPDGLLAFLDRTAEPEKGITEHAKDMLQFCMRDIIDGFDRRVKPTNKKLDVRLRMAALIMQERSGECFEMPKHLFLRNLDAVATAATVSGMPGVAARAKALREKLTNPSRQNSDDGPFGLPDFFDDDDDDYDDDEDYDDEDDDDDAPFRNMPQLIKILEDAIKNGNSQIIDSTRDALLKLGLSKMAMEQAIRNLTEFYKAKSPQPRDTKPKPKPKPKPAPGKKPQPQPPPPPPLTPPPPSAKVPKPALPPPPDPNQPELF